MARNNYSKKRRKVGVCVCVCWWGGCVEKTVGITADKQVKYKQYSFITKKKKMLSSLVAPHSVTVLVCLWPNNKSLSLKLRCIQLTCLCHMNTCVTGGYKGRYKDQKHVPLFPSQFIPTTPSSSGEAVSSQNMTGIVIHKGPKPLIPSMTERSRGGRQRGGFVNTLWVQPRRFNQACKRRGREGKAVSILKGFHPPPSLTSLLFTILPSLPLIYLSFPVCKISRSSCSAFPTEFLSRSVSSSHACRSPKRATLAKQGIWRSEANLLWEVNTETSSVLRIDAMTEGEYWLGTFSQLHVKGIAADMSHWQFLIENQHEKKMTGQWQHVNSQFCAPTESFHFIHSSHEIQEL